MELKTIKMSDVIPDENNPRKDFGDLHSLARTFEGNPYAPNQPFNPIVVVEDGEMYRIADGERRYRAMAIIGVEECQAVVCGGYEEADSIVAMLASDAKEPLKDKERSRAIQQALLLGVAPTVVESTGRLKRGQAKKIKSILKDNNDSIIQTTIDQILEGAALREQGATEEDIEKVLNTEDASWKHIAGNIRQQLNQQKYLAEMKKVLEKYGFDIEDEKPENLTYCSSYNRANTLEDALEKGVPETAYFFFNEYISAIQMYAEVDEGSNIDPAIKEKMDLAAVAIAEGIENRISWYASAISIMPSGKRSMDTPHIDRLLLERANESHSVTHFRDIAGIPDKYKLDRHDRALYGVCAEMCYQMFSSDLLVSDVDIFDENTFIHPNDPTWKAKVTWLMAFVEDGFQLSSQEAEILETAQAFLDDCENSSSVEPDLDEKDLCEEPEEVESLDISEIATEAEMFINDNSIELYEQTPAEIQESLQEDIKDELDVSTLMFDGKATV